MLTQFASMMWQDDRKRAVRFQIENLIDFYVVGISLGLAYAHPSSGDTVASVMIGGLRTVQNGAFPVHTNDLLCVYFDDERDFFEHDGARKNRHLLLDDQDPARMDMQKVVDWVKDGKLNHAKQDNGPKVIFGQGDCSSSMMPLHDAS